MFWGQTSRRILHHPSRRVITSNFRETKHELGHRNISTVKTNQMHQCINFILFWNATLHVSDGLSIHHQDFKTVHTATGTYQTDYCCLLAS